MWVSLEILDCEDGETTHIGQTTVTLPLLG